MKKCYVIIFDLKNPILNHANFIAGIHSSQHWVKVNENIFVISSTMTAAQIRDALLKLMYQGDKIYVSLLGNSAAWFGISEEIATWLRNNQK